MIAINKVLLAALILALFQVQPAAAQDQPAACDQNNFTAFVEWYSGLSDEQQRARLNFPLKVVNNVSDCGDDPVWEEKLYSAQDLEKWSKLLLDQAGLQEADLIRRIVEIGPDRQRVEEIRGNAGFMQEFEFSWDGSCWQLIQITYPSGGC